MRGKKMAGHLGDARVTVGNLEVIRVLPDENLIAIKGAVPGAKGGLGALDLVKQARDSLEQAIGIDPKALGGSAYTSLGSLYYQVPGWPVSFGDGKKAEKLLKQALALSPDGIDPNFFYGDYLFREKRYAESAAALEKALAAPSRPGREIADSGRRKEVEVLLAKARAESKK